MSLLTPLRDRTYAKLFAAQVIALVGTGLTTVALALLAYELADEEAGLVLGAALALKMAAYVTIAPVAGGLGAHLPRKPLLIALDVGRAAFVLCLPFVDALWQVFALIFLLQACSAAFTPTFQATIADVLPDERVYTEALSLSRLAYDLESLLSPSLAAAALLVVAFDALFAANAAAFLTSAALVLVAVVPRSPRADAAGRSRWRQITFGVTAYLATPRLRGLLALSLAVAAAGAMVIVNSVVIVQAHLGLGAEAVAIALGAAGAGSMLAALLLPRLLDRLAERTLMLGAGLVLCLGLVLAAAAVRFEALLIVWFALGASASAINTPAGRLLRRSAAAADRPSYYSAQFALSHLCWLATYLVAGVAGALIGIAPAALILAAIALGGTVAAARLWPERDPLQLRHVHPQLPPDHPHLGDAVPTAAGYAHTHPFVIDSQHPSWPP